MTNFEKYKKEVLDIVSRNVSPIAVCEGRPRACDELSCNDCELYEVNCNCDSKFIRWLYKEYQEKPKLSERAYHFLKSLPNNARIKRSGGLLYMNVEESIVSTYYDYYDDNGFMPLLPLELDLWYEVSEILKWEVEG